MPNLGELERRFAYHPPTGDHAGKYVELRQAFKDLAYLVDQLCPAESRRELDISMEHLETASFWANAAVARHG